MEFLETFSILLAVGSYICFIVHLGFKESFYCRVIAGILLILGLTIEITVLPYWLP